MSLGFMSLGFMSLGFMSLAMAQAGPDDQSAFRRWFTFLVESRYYARKPLKADPGTEGIVNWAYRNALAKHGPHWYTSLELPLIPNIPQPADTDCKEPRRIFVSNNLADAQPGDLLVFEPSEHAPDLAIYVGLSQILPTPEKWVIYQVGPKDVRKVTADSLSNAPLSGVWRLEITAR
jgi:uncharacterized protein YfaT (DUF1175 family)